MKLPDTNELNIAVEKGKDDQVYWVDWIIYKGPETSFDIHKVDRAAFGWATLISEEKGAITNESFKLSDNRLKMEWAFWGISNPIKPKSK